MPATVPHSRTPAGTASLLEPGDRFELSLDGSRGLLVPEVFQAGGYPVGVVEEEGGRRLEASYDSPEGCLTIPDLDR
ncbi:MAG: hypothetical protein JO112_03605, partial [Planctomycetes bacterium]|nr:hypothetical protein [Planctomycetota bacterium]